MGNITAKEIAELRAKIGLPMMEVKKALIEAGGDEAKAIEVLRKKGAVKAEKRSERETKSGLVHSYIHGGGKIGVLVEVLAETDFVAKNEEFKNFVHEIALHIAAANPKYISREEVPQQDIEEEKSVFEEKAAGKPAEIAGKIMIGKLEKYFEEVCLLDQPFIKDQTMKVSDLKNQLIAKIGENIVISRFCRYEIGA